MGKKKNRQYAYKVRPLNKQNATVAPTAQTHHTPAPIRHQQSLSLLARWQKLTIEQKVLAVIIGLIGMGVTVVAIYHLMPVIFEAIRTNPSAPPKFLNSDSTLSEFSQKNSYPIMSSTESKKSTPAILPIPSVAPHKAESNVRLIQPTQKKDLSVAISRVRIDIKPDWRKEIASEPLGLEWISLIEKEISTIRRLLLQTVHPELLLEILADPTFSIELVAYNDADLTGGGRSEGALARYLPLRNKLLIGSDTDMSDKEKLYTLRNEMHHAAIRHTNFAKQSSPEKNLPLPQEALKILRPALKDGWTNDPVLIKEHREALGAGFKRITTFKNLLNQSQHFKQGSLADKKAKDKLNTYLTAVKNYQPIIYAEEMPISTYKILEKMFIKKDENTILPHPEAPGYVISIKTTHHGVILRYSFLESDNIHHKARAFINDIEKFQASVGPNGGYSHYSALEDRELELSSFIQEIDADILKTFFQEWCHYFSRYHKVEDYCTTTPLF